MNQTKCVQFYRPMKPKLSTKKSVQKRFRLTPNGKIKFWPSQLGGKARFVYPYGNFKHLPPLLLPKYGGHCKRKWGQKKPPKVDLVEVLIAAKNRFMQKKGRILTPEEMEQLVAKVKTCKVKGLRVVPGDGQTLKFD